MSSVEAGKFSYIRAFREAIPSSSLKQFLKATSELVEDESFETQKAGSIEPLVYAASSLRFTLFERRAQASRGVNELLRRVDDYVQSPYSYTEKRIRSRPGGPFITKRISHENPLPAALRTVEEIYDTDREQLFVSANRIVDCTKDDFRHLGTELALEIDASSVADMLEAQSGLINDAAMRIRAGQELPRLREVESPLVLPFMRAPFASEVNRDVFIETLASELPVYDIGLAPIAYRSNIIEA